MPPARTGSRASRATSGRNVLFVSHCDFTGSSAYHVYSIATELARRGWSPAIAVPTSARGVRMLGRPDFPVLSFQGIRNGKLAFGDGRGPDLVHAFTPRGPVRLLTAEVAARDGCPYVVHLEDNEWAVRDAVAGAHDAGAVDVFVNGAAGMTVLIERLLELTPEQIPAAVFWPGHDESLHRPGRARELVRSDIGVGGSDLAVVYTGNVHEANAEEIADLYRAVAGLRASGRGAMLVKSGWNGVARSRLPHLGDGLRDLGWIERPRLLELLHAADVLVQPGRPGPFNDYRFPSKLPDYLASGRPVVLPRTNIGLHLRDGVEARLLRSGDADEIGELIASVADDPELGKRLGERGREFALDELRWSKSVDRILALYSRAGVGTAPA